jgi:hypothetical protein
MSNTNRICRESSWVFLSANNFTKSKFHYIPYDMFQLGNAVTFLGMNPLKSKTKLCYDQRSVGQSVLVSNAPSGAQDQIFVTVRHLWVCWCEAPSLTSGRVCGWQLLLALASAIILGFESCGNDHILLSHFRDSPNLEGQVHVFISNRNRVAQLTPQTQSSHFVASYGLQG